MFFKKKWKDGIYHLDQKDNIAWHPLDDNPYPVYNVDLVKLINDSTGILCLICNCNYSNGLVTIVKGKLAWIAKGEQNKKNSG